MDYVIINGTVTSRKEAQLPGFLSNHTFVFTQKVWYGYGGIPLLNENIVLLTNQLESIGANLPELFGNRRELFRRCKRLLNKNKFYRSGHLIFSFFISGPQTAFTVTAENSEEFGFPITEKGVLVNFAGYLKNSKNPLSNLACQNVAFWKAVEAQNHANANQHSVILNEGNFVCEGVASNVFLLKDNILVTPSLQTGCFNDSLRTFILEQCTQLKVTTYESDEIKPAAFFDADEAFFASEAKGIEWILGIESKRFVRSLSSRIHENINEFMKTKVGNS